MITGYPPGTGVSWNLKGTVTTGVIKRVIRHSATVKVNGELVRVEVDGAPAYVVERHTGERFIMHHREVITDPRVYS
ncbi:MAG: HVA1 family protein [Chloroflexota bacterium]